MPPDPFRQLVALTPDQLLQKIERLEERVTSLEKEKRSHYMEDLFTWLNSSELYYVLVKRLEQCGYSTSDVSSFQYQADGTGYVVMTDNKRIDFTM